jgi:hypothetical protein
MSLDQIAIRHQTDKSSIHHNYTPVYEKFFGHLRSHPLVLLELGVGGYWKKNEGFHGAKTWAEYFHAGKIISIDIFEKEPPQNPQIRFFRGSQDDEAFLSSLVGEIGHPDIIIDDASHVNPKTVRSFEILFPMLKPGGTYVIEDCHSSYWDKPASDGQQFFGGIENPGAILNFIKSLTDSINHKHCPVPDRQIESIHFYEKIVFVKKRI